MKVQCKSPGLKQLLNRKISDDPIDFHDGVATVSKEVGSQLIEVYDDLEEVKETSTKSKSKKKTSKKKKE